MGYYDGRTLPFYWKRRQRLRALRPFLLVDPVRHPEQPVLLGLGRPGARRHRPDPGGRLREPADDLRPAPGGRRELEVLRPGLQPARRRISPRRRPTRRPRPPGCRWSTSTGSPTTRRSPATSSAWTSTTRTCRPERCPRSRTWRPRPATTSAPRGPFPLGQGLVSTMVTQLMQSRYWDSSAFMWSYDGSGGWYDDVRPPEMGRPAVGLPRPRPAGQRVRPPGPGQPHRPGLHQRAEVHRAELAARPADRRDAQANSLTSAFDFAAGPRPPSCCTPATAPDAFPVTRAAVSSPGDRGLPAVRRSRRGQRPAAGLRRVVVGPFGAPAASRAASRAAAAKEAGG